MLTVVQALRIDRHGSPRNGILLATPFALEIQAAKPHLRFTGRRSLQTMETHRWVDAVHFSLEINMSDINGASAPERPYNPVTLAKKYRISVEDAKAIVEQYGADRKAVDKAARRIAA